LVWGIFLRRLLYPHKTAGLSTVDSHLRSRAVEIPSIYMTRTIEIIREPLCEVNWATAAHSLHFQGFFHKKRCFTKSGGGQACPSALTGTKFNLSTLMLRNGN
jgi:hypothetical protein